MKERTATIWFHAAGTILVGAFATLAIYSHASLSVWVWLALWCVSWLALLVAWRVAGAMPTKPLLLRLWFLAIVLRVLGFVAQPIFEDDFYRYLWDGRQFAVAGNPYDRAPAELFTDPNVPEQFQEVLSHINHPDVPTIYGPVCQYVFLASYWIAPGQLWPLKAFLLVADLVALALLLRLGNVRHILLYACCPLLIQETAFSAHPEILGISLAVAALWAKGQSRWILSGALAALAVASRIHAILLVPFLLWPLRPRACIAFVATLAMSYAPFWVQGSAADMAGLRAFAGEWEFNSSLFAFAKELLGWGNAKWLSHALFALFAVAWWWKQREVKKVSGDAVYGVFFLLSSVVNPWYLLWLLPFVALRPTMTAMTACFAVSLSYLHGANLGWAELGPYDHPEWLRPLEYGVILAAALCEWRRNLLVAKRNAD